MSTIYGQKVEYTGGDGSRHATVRIDAIPVGGSVLEVAAATAASFAPEADAMLVGDPFPLSSPDDYRALVESGVGYGFPASLTAVAEAFAAAQG